MIASTSGDDAAAELLGRKGRNLIVGAAHLVGAGALHVLRLEEHAIARGLTKMGAFYQFGGNGNLFDLLRGLLERIER